MQAMKQMMGMAPAKDDGTYRKLAIIIIIIIFPFVYSLYLTFTAFHLIVLR